jgi:CheY-like chemotaxis protein
MKQLLVVDDDPDIRQMLKAVLEAHHFAVATAANGRQALELVQADVPDGIFLDIRMPVMDGFRALEAIRREHPHLTIIMISASPNGDIAEKARVGGANGYLPKPIDPQRLKAVLRDSFGWIP